MSRTTTTLARLERERAEAVRAFNDAQRALGAAVAALPEHAALKEAQRRRDAACVKYIAYVSRHNR